MSEQSIIRLTPVRDLFAANDGTAVFDNYSSYSPAHLKALKDHPALCHVCLNLHNVSASVMLGIRGGLWHTADSAIHSRHEKPWEVAYEFHADFADVSAASMGNPGCESCLFLREAITRLRRKIVGPLEKPGLPMEVWVVFRHDVVLRIDLYRRKDPETNDSQQKKGVAPPEDDDFLFGSLDLLGGLDDADYIQDVGKVEDLLDKFELYALPGEPRPSGAPCPWPSIGSSMAAHFPSTDQHCWKGGNVRHVLPDPSSDSCFESIKQWIANCRKEHQDCIEAESRIQHRLPKRVIDVGPADNSKIRLVEHEGEMGPLCSEETGYVALSHCWGPKWTWPIRCVRATLSQFKDNIPFELLSNTFKDAIVITRRLGLRYIWIDSLCIVQDDSRDWEIQAAQMASIYDGAYLTIAATGSESGRAGCLGTRNLGPELISCQSSQGRPCEVYARRAIDHSIFGVTGDDMISSGGNVPREWSWDYPLTDRAWCFQERLLSTRILHYTKSEMVFDCLTGMQCECGQLEDHVGDPLLFPRRIIKLGAEFIHQDSQQGKSWINPADFYRLQRLRRWYEVPNFNLYHQLWHELVVQFSQKQITFRSDALPAVAGLANKWPKDVTGRYFAGLWENQLLQGMRWKVAENTRRLIAEQIQEKRHFQNTKMDEEYVAPSWSWASAKRPVTWGIGRFDDLEYYVQVDYKRSRCHTNGPDEFGRVDSGYIFLTGRITTVSFTLRGDPYEPWIDAKHDAKGFCWDLGRVDDERRLHAWSEKQLVCLRFSEPMSTSEVAGEGRDCCLVLGPPNPRNLERQPEEVRKFKNVYERVGILMGYRTTDWHHDEKSEEMSMYII